MSYVAPIARLATAYGAGAAAGSAGAPLWMAPLALAVGAAAPESTSRRPGRAWLLVTLAAGWLAASPGASAHCATPAAGSAAKVQGHFLATPRAGSAPFLRYDGCGTVTVVVEPSDTPAAGHALEVGGRWRHGSFRPWLQASTVAGTREVGGSGAVLGRATVRWRDGLVARLPRLYGERAPLVAALLFARREGMDRDVREAFTVSGIAHLLAISGFHVGVIAGLALAILRALGASRRRSMLGAAAFGWLYVGFIGFPDAACRAALILGLVALSRARGRPPTRWGALAGAAVVLLLVDPAKLVSAGFQLSFAGAAGLVAWARPIEGYLSTRSRGRLPRSFASAVAAGVAATVATLPIVAWHFERASLVGIPMTLVASPLVSLALPGALATIALDPVAPAASAFLAGGVDVLLQALVAITTEAAGWHGVSLWMARSSVAAAVLGVLVASWIARRPRIGRRARRRLIVAYAAAAVVGWPLAVGLEGRGRLELLAIDVGQGDALALRSPRGRWLLVDAGPPPIGAEPAHPVVRALRARGVRRLELMVLTHPDADHFGGAAAVLRSFEVGAVVDPLVAAPKRSYVELLLAARDAGVPWRAAAAGTEWEVDGVRITVLHPMADLEIDAAEANEASVVLMVEWRGFEALLTGDAYKEVERSLMARVGDIDVLKVGHHGSETSSDPGFLAAIRAEVAVISVGRSNRYGHPAPGVLRRLEAAGSEILRTDLSGDVRVVVEGDGSFAVRTGR